MKPTIVILWTIFHVVNGVKVYGPAEQPLQGVRTIKECESLLPQYVDDRREDGWTVTAPGCYATAEVGP